MSDRPEDATGLPPEDAAELPLEERLSEAALAALMGDPYEVGLRIALGDGVAEALPAVARELAFLDRAVAAAQAGVAGLASAPLPQPVRPVAAAVGADAVPVSPDRGAAPALAVSAGVRRPGGAMDTVTRAAERVAADAVPVSMRQAAPALPQPVPRETVSGETVSREMGLRETVSREAGRLDWGGVDWGRLSAVPGVAPAAGEAAPLPAVLAAAVDAAVPEAFPAMRAAASSNGSDQALPSAAPAAIEGLHGLAPSGRDAEPRGVAAPWPEAGEPDAAVAGAETERAIEGRLEIDGALLGRFVAEHLAREAGRPPSGMTGFDPLLSPEWAGALQG